MANEEHLAQRKQGFLNVLARARHALTSGAACVYVGVRTWIAERQVGESIRQTSKRVIVRLRSTPWQEVARQYLPLLGGLGVLLFLFTLWKLPQWYAASWEDLTGQDKAKLESDTRTTLVQTVGGLALFIGLYFTAKSWRTTQEGQITDRFTKAINQLGEAGPEKLAIRLGGIYALERIARDSERDHWPIMEVLTAYVREKALRPPKNAQPLADDLSPMAPRLAEDDQSPWSSATDIRAILTVLKRRTWTFEKEEQVLDLSEADLPVADLRGAHLEKARLLGAHLEGADLHGAHLKEANLTRATLKSANLMMADLQKATLEGANLIGAQNLKVEQLSTVKTLYVAQLDPPLLERIKQEYPHLVEKP
jgi:hypothetical protein